MSVQVKIGKYYHSYIPQNDGTTFTHICFKAEGAEEGFSILTLHTKLDELDAEDLCYLIQATRIAGGEEAKKAIRECLGVK